MSREDVVAALVARGKWAPETAEMAVDANFTCEYCGRDLLGSLESYQFQLDHIVPKHLGGSDDRANLAVCCWYCNFHLKRKWDPRERAGQSGSRIRLISEVRKYVAEVRIRRNSDLDHARSIAGWRILEITE